MIIIIIGWFLWLAIWFAAGYFTLKAVLDRIEYRRTVKQIRQIDELRSEVERALRNGES